ncbi:MAG: 4Fe-4S binding protein, partial [Thermodesulfobacteriota bacterium]|nr:4Fe-4S binding protein [Thermodesulfobacteriota bacterium]
MAIRVTLCTWRKLSQILFALLFLLLFRLTDYSGLDEIPYAVNIFFRWDPLVASSVLLATKSFIAILLPSLFIIALTVVFGRVFCGWICPMGTLLDVAGKVIQSQPHRGISLRPVKYILLTIILTSSLFGLQLVGFFDPFSILVRGMTLGVDPAFNLLASGFFDPIYRYAPEWISNISEPVYTALKDSLLPYQQSFFQLSTLSACILIAVVALEKLSKRFWCRNLCPLGALLAIFSRFSIFRRFPGQSCKDCQHCAPTCRMNAFDLKSRQIRHEECNLCMDCVDDCVKQPSRFRFTRPDNQIQIDMNRRAFLGAGLAGISMPLLSRVNVGDRMVRPTLLRPPGATSETEFFSSCVRCGECMKVCIQNALQPCFMESGYEGMFTPRLIPRLGYCEFNCTLCGQVCPTGAIRKLSQPEKNAFVIGKAVFDKARCLPFAEHSPCIVCEEHCPTHDKAIKFKKVTKINDKGESVELRQPYVIPELCIGCGICENKCPLPGYSAIRVFRTSLASREDDFGYGAYSGINKLQKV